MADKPVNSPKLQSLDEIVSQSAVVIAEQIRKAASWAKSEMDLQVEVAGILKDFARQAKIDLSQGHHNITIATGRPDSVYGSVIVEYKEPGTLSPNKEAAPNKAVIDQLKKRFYDMNREEHRNWRSMFGAGTDGKYFIFLRFRDDKWTDQEPLEVNRYSTERFLWALYNLGQKGKPYQPEYLHGDFGSESTVAQEGVRALYEEVLATQNPKAQVFFNQWKILFGEVCGYDVDNLSDKLKKLAQFYVVKGKPQPAPLLFAVHTYYAILIKLLAAEIVSFFNPWMPRQVEKLQSAETPAKLKRELEELERGGIFHQMGITNFLEGDLFSWYLAAWTEPIRALVGKMITKLDEYNPGTFSEEPAQSRDLLKKLYQQLFPKSVRHDLGEYYTPDWLAEHVLNELGYEGDPDKRLLDPACGSGTFLVMAINRIRRWYDLNREKCAYDEGGLLEKILANVIGFDLNPLAVMAARTNYLVAIKDFIRHVEGVEIPVYLCDSIMTPAEYGDLFTGGGKVARVPCSAMKPPHLLVPKEIAQNPKEVARYADQPSNSVAAGLYQAVRTWVGPSPIVPGTNRETACFLKNRGATILCRAWIRLHVYPFGRGFRLGCGHRPVNSSRLPKEAMKMKTLLVFAVLVAFLSLPVAFGQATSAAENVKATPSTAVPTASGCNNCAATTAPSRQGIEAATKPIPGTSETMVVGRVENLIPIGVLTVLGCEKCSAEAVNWALEQGSSFEDIERTLRTVAAMQKLDCFKQQFGPEVATRMEKPLAAAKEALARARTRAGK